METESKEKITIQYNLDISKDDNYIRIAFYANIGFFIEIAQMLEFNLRKLICYYKSVTEIEASEITKENVEKICKSYDNYYDKTYKDKYTLGKLTKELRKIQVIDPKILDKFDEINNYRIKVVHMIFQNNVIVDKFKDSKYVLEYNQNRLIPMINITNATNKFVIEMINTFKESLREYKTQVGIAIQE
ncbi:MAG TPA: hypothetical protein GX708_02250 [Gallicola sp.]|nr:hypothetical protein [Gallicola sp.]